MMEYPIRHPRNLYFKGDFGLRSYQKRAVEVGRVCFPQQLPIGKALLRHQDAVVLPNAIQLCYAVIVRIWRIRCTRAMLHMYWFIPNRHILFLPDIIYEVTTIVATPSSRIWFYVYCKAQADFISEPSMSYQRHSRNTGISSRRQSTAGRLAWLVKNGATARHRWVSDAGECGHLSKPSSTLGELWREQTYAAWMHFLSPD